jgi:hypothetical protein
MRNEFRLVIDCRWDDEVGLELVYEVPAGQP